jgi:hypothetical protein
VSFIGPGPAFLRRLNRPVHALPVDLFRILAGLLGFAYFVHLVIQSPDFTSPGGLLDHALIQRVFWYTRLGLFQPGMGLAFFQAMFALAAAAALMVAAGVRVPPAAAVMYLTAVSTYRWNFLAMYVDDALMHLVFFWLMWLPAGRTLALADWLRGGRAAAERWKREHVPGAAVRFFLANIALAYLVAGLWKWTSPMWREGIALYAVLKLPIAHAPDLWQPAHLPWLKPANHFVLALETLLPLVVALPAGHWGKRMLGLGLVGFHLGIIATLKIPYANLALLAAAVIIFRDELMQWIAGRASPPSSAPPLPAVAPASRLGLLGTVPGLVVACLAAAMLWDLGAPAWRSPSQPALVSRTAGLGAAAGTKGEPAGDLALARQQNPLYGALWMIGIAQSYRLFDWIDDRNFSIRYEVAELGPEGQARAIASQELFPQSIRSILLQSYLHGITWFRVPEADKPEVEASLYTRFARRYCRTHPDTGRIVVHANTTRITAENIELSERSRRRFMEFECRAGAEVIHFPELPAGLTSR